MDRVYVMQLVRSFQCGQLSRRQFLKRATAAIGSVAAANMLLTACSQATPEAEPPPVVDEEATAAPPAEEAPAEGLVTMSVEYPDADGETLMGYLARPDDEEAHLAVVVIQEWWGLNEHIKDVTRRFAEEGFVALAPDLYHGQVTTEPDEARKLVMELDTPQAVSEIGQAIDYLKEQAFTMSEQAGIVGFCMGGGLVLQTALADEDVGAGVAFYGRPLSPEEAANMETPILGFFGAEDQGIPVEEVQAMADAFAEAGITHEIEIYEGAGHAFFNETRDSYNEEAAQDAWPRTLAWFRDHLGDSA